MCPLQSSAEQYTLFLIASPITTLCLKITNQTSFTTQISLKNKNNVMISDSVSRT